MTTVDGERLARIETILEQLPDTVAQRIEHTDASIRQLVTGVERDVGQLHERHVQTESSLDAAWRKLDRTTETVDRVVTSVDRLVDAVATLASLDDVDGVLGKLTSLDDRLARLEMGWTDPDGATIPQRLGAVESLLDRSRWTLVGYLTAAGSAGGAAGVLFQALAG